MSDVAPIAYLVGAPAGEPLQAVLDRLVAAAPWAPFDPRAQAFAAALSRRLLRGPAARQHPELAALAHWFRPAALRDLALRYAPRPGEQLLGRGLAFHLAPANVDSVATYSWLLSLLAGNANLVRMSQKASEQLDVLVEAIRDTLAGPEGGPIADRVVMLTYPHSEGVTRLVSQRCHLRVVWGGDATVAALRAIPLRPTAHELCFPNRFSAAALGAAAVAACEPAAFARLVHDFCNDAFWFAQQACSSPRLLAWIGPADACDAARQRFWPAVEQELARRNTANTAAMAMDRLAAAFTLAAEDAATPAAPLHAYPLRLALTRGLARGVREAHGGQGLFLERHYPALAALAPELTDTEQTLAVFGIDAAEIEATVPLLAARAVDRIVPVGQALAFSAVWDGHDLVAAFCRRLTLPAGAGATLPAAGPHA
jgi:hypothetical protein